VIIVGHVSSKSEALEIESIIKVVALKERVRQLAHQTRGEVRLLDEDPIVNPRIEKKTKISIKTITL